MIEVPDNILHLASYKPGKSVEDIKKEYGLSKVAQLSSNENTFGPSPKAVKTIMEAIESMNWYPDASCTDLREQIASKFYVSEKQVIVGNGSEGVLSYIFKAFFENGKELLTSEGTFVAVYIWAKANNIPCKKIKLKEDYSFDLDTLVNNISDKTKAIYLANPNNPTGTLFKHSELMNFLAKVPDDILVIVDEAYYEFASVLSETYPDTLASGKSNVIVLRTFSKAYGLAGVRIGYGLASEELITQLMKVKLTFEPSLLAQAGGIGAIQDDEYLDKIINNNIKGLNYFYEAFEALNLHYIKSYANFVMIALASEERVNYIHQKLMEKGILVRPLKGFGLPHCMRITVGQPDENEMFVNALKEIL
jgi:histidinol-phosphate aminotransferase